MSRFAISGSTLVTVWVAGAMLAGPVAAQVSGGAADGCRFDPQSCKPYSAPSSPTTRNSPSPDNTQQAITVLNSMVQIMEAQRQAQARQNLISAERAQQAAQLEAERAEQQANADRQRAVQVRDQTARQVNAGFSAVIDRLDDDPKDAPGAASQTDDPQNVDPPKVAFVPRDPEADFTGKACAYFTRPAVEAGGARLNYYADGSAVGYGTSAYVCKDRHWKRLVGNDASSVRPAEMVENSPLRKIEVYEP